MLDNLDEETKKLNNDKKEEDSNIDVIDISGSMMQIEKIKKKRKNVDILKEFIKLSIPYTINGLAINGSFFINTLILSELGADTLAATSLATSAQLLTVASAKAMLSSTSVVIARNSGTEDTLGVILQQSWIQSLIETVPIAVLFIFSKQIFKLLGQKPEISAIAGDYLQKYSIALPSVLLLKSSEQFAVATGHPNLVLVTNVLNLGMTAGLTYILALGKFGSPQLGVSGSAYAAASSNFLSLIGLTLYFLLNSNFKKYEIFKLKSGNRSALLKTLFVVGGPIGIQVGVEFLYNFGKSIIAGVLGSNSLSAEQIVTQYSSLVLSPIFAISTINGILVGNDIAKNGSANIKSIGKIGIGISIIVPLLALVLFTTIPKQLAQPFINKNDQNYEAVVKIATNLFIVNGVNNVIDAIKNSSAGALRGFYDTAVPTLIMLSALWLLGAPSSYLLTFTAGLGITGTFLGRGISLSASVPLLLYRWNKSANNPEAAIESSKISLKDKFCAFFRPCKEKTDNKTKYLTLSDNEEKKDLNVVNEQEDNKIDEKPTHLNSSNKISSPQDNNETNNSYCCIF